MPNLPSEWLTEVIEGRIALKDAPDSIQSWARFHVYQAAVGIVRLSSKEARNKALDMLPERIRPIIHEEVGRIWKWRGEL